MPVLILGTKAVLPVLIPVIKAVSSVLILGPKAFVYLFKAGIRLAVTVIERQVLFH